MHIFESALKNHNFRVFAYIFAPIVKIGLNLSAGNASIAVFSNSPNSKNSSVNVHFFFLFIRNGYKYAKL